jgi:glycosyltransferase involved in cell wall biosynthesis
MANPDTEPKIELSLVFPVFDEEENLDSLVGQALEIGGRLANRFEVVLVDDGSRDRSPEIIHRWCRSDSRVRWVRHASNRGYGAALRAGLRVAEGELVFFSDADLQFDLSELEKLVSHAERFEIVAGYRFPRRDPWPRRVIAFSWGWLVGRLFDLPVRDIDCAFKVFQRRALEAIAIESLGAFINTEILVRCSAAGHRIRQVPVTHRARQRGRQTGAHPRVIVRALTELASLYRELRWAQRSGRAAAVVIEPAARAGASHAES